MKNNTCQKINGIMRNSKKVNFSEKWKNEEQIIDYAIAPALEKFSEEQIAKGVKIFVELDAIFLNIKMENVEGYIYHERYSHPTDAKSDLKALKNYLDESGYITEKTKYGFCAILKP